MSIPAEAAVAACTRIIDAQLEHRWRVAAAHYLRGNARTFLILRPDPHAEAIADYDRAIRLRPDFADAFFERGRSRARTGNVPGALEDFNTAVRYAPDRVDLLSRRADQLASLGYIDSAIAGYSAALQLRPLDTAMLWRRALLFERRQLWNEALADYDAAVRERFGVVGLTGRCRTKLMLDRARDALIDCTRAIESSGSFSPAYAWRGLAFFVLGDHEGAKDDWTRAANTRVDDGVQPLGRFGLAMLREASGDNAGATDDFAALRRTLRDEAEWIDLETMMGRFRRR